METSEVLTKESLFCFLEKYGDSRAKRELLAFWGRHPNAKFSRLALSHALDQSKLDIDRALKDMAEAGLVDIYSRHGVTFYALTTNDEKRRTAVELAALDWDQWQLMLRHIEWRDKETVTGG